MAAFVLYFSGILFLASSLKLGHYQFGYNFGQVFYDYSGSGNHALNGASINQDISDVIPTDRGAYLAGNEKYIKLPKNSINSNSITLQNTFSYALWINIDNQNSVYTILISTDYVSKHVYILWHKDYNRVQCHYLVPTAQERYSNANTKMPGMKYLGQWNILLVLVDQTSAKCYINQNLVIDFTLTNSYMGLRPAVFQIGVSTNSVIGFVWSLYIFDSVVDPAVFSQVNYQGTYCLGSNCSTYCNSAVKENDDIFCISSSTSVSCANCAYGCKNNICLDCSSCNSKSCVIESNQIICICPQGNLQKYCTCYNGWYFISNNFTCIACNQDCLTCNKSSKCSSCKDINSEPSSLIGCVCKKGSYYDATSGTCKNCYHDCSECTTSNKCTFCISSYAYIDSNLGCICNEGYYNSTSLISSDSCKSCYITCKSCSTSTVCLTCNNNYSEPTNNIGCRCKIGYYNLTALEVGGFCSPCHSNCKECTEPLKCVNCIDINAEKDDLSGCYCKPGFYNITSLNTDGSCLNCFKECYSCSGEFKCIKCIDSNSTVIDSGGCLCKEGFYNQSQVVAEGMCLKCHNECKTCNISLLCSSCLDTNSIPSPIEGCDCIESFYKDTDGICKNCHIDCKLCKTFNSCDLCSDNNSFFNGSQCICNSSFYNSSLTETLTCSKCPENCTQCESLSLCNQCLYSHMSPINGSCICSPFSTLKNDSCIADPGYYMSNDPISGFSAKKCDLSCLTCIGEGSQNCEICANNIVKKNGKCNSCESGMFLKDYFCHNCSEDCISCLNSSFCLSCLNSSDNLYQGVCSKTCPSFKYLSNDTCEDCPELCIECNPKCLNCVDNAILTSKNNCLCQEGFELSNGSCTEKLFSAVLIIKSINLATLQFSERLRSELKKQNFLISVENRSDLTTTFLKSKGKFEYYFKLSFEKEVKKGTIINFEILNDSVISVNNSQLKDYIIYATLPSYSPIIVNSAVQAVLASTTAAAQAAVSSSVGASLVSNPAAAWALLNSIQILVFLPLNSNEMTPNLKIFLKGFSGYNIIPDVLGSIFDEKASSSPFLEARRYGIESSVFLKNTGKSFIIFGTVFVIWPFVYVLSKCNYGKIAAKAIKILGNYKYSFFLRFWTQSFLEVFVFSIVQLKSTVLIPIQGYFNQLLATIVAIAAILTLPLIFISCYVNFNKITEGSENFKKKWGSLFLEFKNDKGFFSCLYYFLYFSRRVAFGLVQIYLNSFLLLQGGLNILFSVIVLIFLVYYRPFKDELIFITNIVGEVATTIVMILTYTYLWNFNHSTQERVEMTIIFIVLSSILIQTIVSMYSFFKSLKILWFKLEKMRSLQFVKNFEDQACSEVAAN